MSAYSNEVFIGFQSLKALDDEAVASMEEGDPRTALELSLLAYDMASEYGDKGLVGRAVELVVERTALERIESVLPLLSKKERINVAARLTKLLKERPEMSATLEGEARFVAGLADALWSNGSYRTWVFAKVGAPVATRDAMALAALANERGVGWQRQIEVIRGRWLYPSSMGVASMAGELATDEDKLIAKTRALIQEGGA